LTALSRKNDCGVYTDREVIELQLDKKGWRGCPLAEIRLALTEAGWRSASAFSFSTGNWWGCSSPIMDCDPPFASREAAIDHAAADIRRSMEAKCIDDSMRAQRAKIIAWLDEMRPAQLTLF
jgi:hypothetical protein